MPLWQLFVPEDAYSPEDKIGFAEDITKIYSEGVGLPRFYVSVIFHDVPKHSFLIGGEPRSEFVRVSIDHIARRFEELPERLGLPQDVDLAGQWRDVCAAVLKPWVADRGFNWELHTDETPIAYWYIDGLTPPPGWSEQEKTWAEENRATPYAATDEVPA